MKYFHSRGLSRHFFMVFGNGLKGEICMQRNFGLYRGTMKREGVVKGRGLIRIKGLTTVTNTMVWDDHFGAKELIQFMINVKLFLGQK